MESSLGYSVPFPTVHSADELAALIEQVGFLPAFRNAIPGFSVEDCIDPAFWFPTDGQGFWEWKGPVIRQSGCAYGKFAGGRAAFVSLPLYCALANYRRDGYDFDARYEDGLARHRDKQVFDVLWEHGSLLSSELSRLCAGSGSRGERDEILTRLQMQGYAVISNFEYAVTRKGARYGWGTARYETPEYRFGAAFTSSVYAQTPAESKQLLFTHLRSLLPTAPEKSLWKLIG